MRSPRNLIAAILGVTAASLFCCTAAGADMVSANTQVIPDGGEQAGFDGEDGLVDDFGEAYLESIGADPDQERELVGYDEELGVEIYDSSYGHFYVDEEAAAQSLRAAYGEGNQAAPSEGGAVEYVEVDLDVEDLTPEAIAEFEALGLSVDELFGPGGDTQAAELPDAELIRAAGECEVELGENAVAKLRECAAARR